MARDLKTITRTATLIAVIRHIASGKEGMQPDKARTLLSSIKIALMQGEKPEVLLKDITDAQLTAAGYNTGRAALFTLLNEGLAEAVAQVTHKRHKKAQLEREKKAKSKISKLSRKNNR